MKVKYPKCKSCHRDIPGEYVRTHPWAKLCPQCNLERAPFNKLSLNRYERGVKVIY